MTRQTVSLLLLLAGMTMVSVGLWQLWPAAIVAPGVVLVWLSTLNGGGDGSG